MFSVVCISVINLPIISDWDCTANCSLFDLSDSQSFIHSAMDRCFSFFPVQSTSSSVCRPLFSVSVACISVINLVITSDRHYRNLFIQQSEGQSISSGSALQLSSCMINEKNS